MSADQEWSVDDDTDPDSTADGMLRPDLSGIPDDLDEAGPPTGAYRLPEIVPATADPDPVPEPEPKPNRVISTTPRPTAPKPAAPAAPTQAWHDLLPAVTAPPAQLRAPGRRPRVRRVTRVVRHVDPWSVFKIGLIFSLVAYVACLTAGVLLWRVADATGTIDNVERWFTQFGWETFEFRGGEIFHNAWIIGLFGVVAMTGGLVLLATLFNLVSDIVGGIRVSVLEEEVVERTVSSARRYVVRRPPATAAAGTIADPTWSVDDTPPPAAAPADVVPAAEPIPETVPPDWSVDD